MRKNKKAWIRIVEAFLAILIIVGVFLTIISRQGTSVDITESVHERQRQILNLISENNNLREDILLEDNLKVNESILKMIPAHWNFATNICDLGEVCPNPEGIYDREVYSTEVLITTNLTYYQPKRLRFFVWMESLSF